MTEQIQKRRPAAEGKKKSLLREISEWAVSFIIALALAVTIHAFVAQPVLVDGSSMSPTLLDGERMLVTKFDYLFGAIPERGDIVVTHFSEENPKNYVKRVIALPGETLEIRDGVVYINGQRLDEPYVAYPSHENMDPMVVPEDYVMVMGDNRADSQDSRLLIVGPIKTDLIRGKVRTVIWPFNEIRGIKEYTGTLNAE